MACAADGTPGYSSVGAFFSTRHPRRQKLLVPLYGAGDFNLITGTETSPNITQSETFSWANPDNPQQVVVAYNDSRGRNASPINISGAIGIHRRRRYFHPGHHRQRSKPLCWYRGRPCCFCTIALTPPGSPSGSIRPAAVRASVATSPPIPRTRLAGPTSAFITTPRTTGILAGRTNNPSSPFANRMYISWNDFNVGGGALFVTYSSDNGTTWHSPISVNPSFVRDVQITGDKITGTCTSPP